MLEDERVSSPSFLLWTLLTAVVDCVLWQQHQSLLRCPNLRRKRRHPSIFSSQAVLPHLLFPAGRTSLTSSL